MKTYKNFINENLNDPDLRRIHGSVKCIKSIPRLFTKNKNYKIKGLYGDPQRAVEEFGINNYLPVDCMSAIEIFSNTGSLINFRVSNRYGFFKNIRSFFEFFEIIEVEDKRRIKHLDIDPFEEEDYGWETIKYKN